MDGDAQGDQSDNKSNERLLPSPFCTRNSTFHRTVWNIPYDEAVPTKREARTSAYSCDISSAAASSGALGDANALQCWPKNGDRCNRAGKTVVLKTPACSCSKPFKIDT